MHSGSPAACTVEYIKPGSTSGLWIRWGARASGAKGIRYRTGAPAWVGEGTMVDVVSAPDAAPPAPAPAALTQYDLSEAVRHLRYMRFAEYCFIFIGLAL